jgi:hypothetical protein
MSVGMAFTEVIVRLVPPPCVLTTLVAYDGPLDIDGRPTTLRCSTPWAALPDLLLSEDKELVGLVYGSPLDQREAVRRLCARFSPELVTVRDEDGATFVYIVWGREDWTEIRVSQSLEVGWYYCERECPAGDAVLEAVTGDLFPGLDLTLFEPVGLGVSVAEIVELEGVRPPTGFRVEATMVEPPAE